MSVLLEQFETWTLEAYMHNQSQECQQTTSSQPCDSGVDTA